MINQKDKEALRKWEAFKESIASSTSVELDETAVQRSKRIESLLKNWEAFANYYFPHYCKAPFSKWQKRFAKKLIAQEKITITRKIHREGAKSVIAGVILPLYLKFDKQLKNMLLVSNNWDMATELLKPIQGELEANQRLINDFGIQKGVSSWMEGRFITTDGVSFRALGLGQSPRGTRNREARPDFILVDDLDQDEMCENEDRVEKAFKWVTRALLPTMSLKGRARFVMVGNIIATNTILQRMSDQAHDTEQVDLLIKGEIDESEVARLKRKMAATSDEHTKKVLLESIGWAMRGYKPSWPENFALEDCVYRIMEMGSLAAEQEYFNNPIITGKIFKKEWMQHKKMLPLYLYNFLVAYLDPGFAKSKTSDSKSLNLIGLHNGEFHIIKSFCGQASIQEMVEWGYEMDTYVKQNGGSYTFKMEEVFLQYLLYKDFSEAAIVKGYSLPVSGDTRKKPDKDQRIEGTSGYFERGKVFFNEAEKENHHQKELINQYISFSRASKTKKDGPDCCEGGFHILTQGVQLNTDITIGKRTTNNKHKI